MLVLSAPPPPPPPAGGPAPPPPPPARLHLNCSSILPAAKRTNGYSPATTSPTSKHSEPSRNPPSPRATPSAPTTPPLPRSPSTRRWAWYGCGASSGLRRRTIISPQLTERQAIGGITGGIGTALLEHTVTDHRDGRIVNANLADYLVHDKGRHPAKDIGAAAWGTSTCCACTSPIPPTWPR
ncbi:molybdopterin cofactor-binding domain-containing protein [Streptomyces viridiviolaceus]